VITGAGVFKILASWAIAQIENESLHHGLGIRLGFDLHDDWEHLALWECLVRD
jgi:hypothetical protein